jgi:hypothetical protein
MQHILGAWRPAQLCYLPSWCRYKIRVLSADADSHRQSCSLTRTSLACETEARGDRTNYRGGDCRAWYVYSTRCLGGHYSKPTPLPTEHCSALSSHEPQSRARLVWIQPTTSLTCSGASALLWHLQTTSLLSSIAWNCDLSSAIM